MFSEETINMYNEDKKQTTNFWLKPDAISKVTQ